MAQEKPAISGDGTARLLLAWYDANHRELPWRVSPGAYARGVRADPYHVWLSEVMLQQTTVEAVKPYFLKFLAQWPTVSSLSTAPLDEILRAWAGLGYYSRARNLKLCADKLAASGFPRTATELQALPGVGPYTAAAIAAIAFDQPAAVVDGNVERVTTRLFNIQTPLPEAKAEIRTRVETITPTRRPGDFAQAMMDLGATICTPKRPRCMICPLREGCQALAAGDPEPLPRRLPKPEKPGRRGVAHVAVRRDGAVLMRTRPEKGLLGGMTEVPTSEWTAGSDGPDAARKPPFPADWRKVGAITHVFTHFALELTVFRAVIGDLAPPSGHRWVAADDIPDEALPTVMKKVVEAALPGATRKKPRNGAA